MGLWEYVRAKVEEHPSQLIEENGESIKFSELISQAEEFGKNLTGLTCCAILCRTEINGAIALLACISAGVTAVPLSYRYGENHYTKILNHIRPDAMICDDDKKLKVMFYYKADYHEPKIHPAVIMCTSGTTGRPKGVMLSEGNILANLKDILEYFTTTPEDAFLIARPLYHAAVLTGEFLVALSCGSKIRFYSEQMNPKKLLDTVRTESITIFCGTPTLLYAMAKLGGKEWNSSLNTICISGECLRRTTGEVIRDAFCECKIHHVYGLTEASPRVSHLPPAEFSTNMSSVGVPLKSVKTKIILPTGREAEAGAEGILWVRGENVMLGYYKDPQKTDEVLKNGWLCTGDTAVLGKNGRLYIRGRRDDMIIRGGMNIYPAEIEETLKAHPLIQEVLAYGYEEKNECRIGLKIVGEIQSVEQIRMICAQLLPIYQMPSKYELLKELPKNATGKMIRSVNS